MEFYYVCPLIYDLKIDLRDTFTVNTTMCSP